MAISSLLSPLLPSPSRQLPFTSTIRTSISVFIKPIQCVATTIATVAADEQKMLTRRSGNYIPSPWDYDFVQSFAADLNDKECVEKVEKMKEYVKSLIHGEKNALAKLELIDSIQRLGLKYQFEKDINDALISVYNNTDTKDVCLNNGDLYATAIYFRLSRQHRSTVLPQDVFERFMNEEGEFDANLCEDMKGILGLYEASFYGFQDEDIIDEAKRFTTVVLKNKQRDDNMTTILARKVNHALDMPLHWRLNRVEARWFVDTYQQEEHMNPTLLQLAKMDYNMVQLVHRKEVSKLARWWLEMGLDKVEFARDRLVEHFFWCNGFVFEPQYSHYRDMSTKIICLITTIDDIYDVYGSLEELELFTDFVVRWDITEIDKLPKAIKSCLLAMFNTVNEIGYWTIKERGFNIIPYLRKWWADLCKAYMKEATWYHNGHKHTLNSYLEHAVVSIAGPLMLYCTYFLTTEEISKEALDYLDKLPSVIRAPAKVIRLTNDLGTSSHELARGDTLKAVQCYMNDTGVSEEEAREYISNLVHETWKTINEDQLKSYPFSEPFLSANANLARTAQCFYQYGDGHGFSDGWIKGHLKDLIVEPIPFN